MQQQTSLFHHVNLTPLNLGSIHPTLTQRFGNLVGARKDKHEPFNVLAKPMP